MSNDFRENCDHMFYHVSTTGGATWTDDSMVGGADPFTGFIPLTFQSDPGVAFDTVGHSFLSTITGNLIFAADYANLDTEIETAEGFANGTYTSLLPTVVDDQPCFFSCSTTNCPAQLDKPLITIDNVPGSPNKARSMFITHFFAMIDVAGTEMQLSLGSPQRSSNRMPVAQDCPSRPRSW